MVVELLVFILRRPRVRQGVGTVLLQALTSALEAGFHDGSLSTEQKVFQTDTL